MNHSHVYCIQPKVVVGLIIAMIMIVIMIMIDDADADANDDALKVN